MIDGHLQSAGVFLIVLAVASAAQAQTCPAPVANCGSLSGVAPVALSSRNHYFGYNGQVLPLIGISYEYLPHVCLYSSVNPQLVNQYVNLTNYQTVFSTLASNHNNIVRLVAIFNSSPGFHDQNNTAPFPHEAPFVWNATLKKWDPSQPIDPTWINDLEAVVCSAYSNDLIVEVTLFDPWDPSYTYSPFNDTVTTNSSGFSAQQYFASFEFSNMTDGPQNSTGRTNQTNALTAVVNRLKNYPNVIWQIANEPDFDPSGTGLIPSIVAWEQAMANKVRSLDTTHLIMVNGHYTGGSCGSACAALAWNVTNDGYPSIESAHYTAINTPNFDGAIALMRDTNPSITAQKGNVAFGFDENQPVSSTNYPWRKAADMRAEVWEFLMYTGGLFNGYSLDKTMQGSKDASTQLGALYNTLTTTSIGGKSVYLNFDAMHQTTCITGNWCAGLTGWGQLEVRTSEVGCTPTQPANIYWATMSDDPTLLVNAAALYLHHGVAMSKANQSPPGPPINDSYFELTCGDGNSSGYQTNVTVTLPKGCFNIQWVQPATGVSLSSWWVSSPYANGGVLPLTSPLYSDDVALLVRRQLSGTCAL